ncbi:MAG: cytochrome b N-terminal domain-containing protein [Pseudomonadota bacterium]
MSGGHIPQEHTEPKTDFGKWVDNRLPIGGLLGHLNDFPTPKNLNWMWVFGGILAVCLVIQIATGVVLAMHYTPHVDHAFTSVEHIMRDVNGGWWLRYSHAVGASFFFIAVYAHIFRGMYYGSYKEPREILWIIGVLIYLLMMATAFMGYVLPWGQMSFWGATVITALFSAIPVVGDSILIWLQGGYSIDNAALNRFFALHYLLPFAIAGLVILHIWALHHVGNNNPTGVSVRNDSVETAKKDTVPFTPFYTVKDLFAIIVFLIIFALFVFYLPNYLGHADNYIPADPLVTPAHIVPEWYFLPFYAILRSVPDKLMGVLLMFASIGVLALLPWLDTSRTRSGAYRPLFKQFFWLFIVTCFVLGYVGAKNPDNPVIDLSSYSKYETEDEALAAVAEIRSANPDAMISMTQNIDFEKNVAYWEVGDQFAFRYIHLGQLLTLYYFAFFLVILPVLGIIERPKRPPETIEADFAAKHPTKAPSGVADGGPMAAPAE